MASSSSSALSPDLIKNYKYYSQTISVHKNCPKDVSKEGLPITSFMKKIEGSNKRIFCCPYCKLESASITLVPSAGFLKARTEFFKKLTSEDRTRLKIESERIDEIKKNYAAAYDNYKKGNHIITFDICRNALLMGCLDSEINKNLEILLLNSYYIIIKNLQNDLDILIQELKSNTDELHSVHEHNLAEVEKITDEKERKTKKESTIERFKKLIKIMKMISVPYEKLPCFFHIQLGDLLVKLENISRAIDYYEKAIWDFNNILELNLESQLKSKILTELSKAYISLAQIYQKHSVEKSIEYFNSSIMVDEHRLLRVENEFVRQRLNKTYINVCKLYIKLRKELLIRGEEDKKIIIICKNLIGKINSKFLDRADNLSFELLKDDVSYLF